jgi:hypothetical protein
MMDARDHPTTADYAMHEVKDAQQRLKLLDDKIEVEVLHKIHKLEGKLDALEKLVGRMLEKWVEQMAATP